MQRVALKDGEKVFVLFSPLLVFHPTIESIHKSVDDFFFNTLYLHVLSHRNLVRTKRRKRKLFVLDLFEAAQKSILIVLSMLVGELKLYNLISAIPRPPRRRPVTNLEFFRIKSFTIPFERGDAMQTMVTRASVVLLERVGASGCFIQKLIQLRCTQQVLTNLTELHN